MKTGARYSREVWARVVRMVFEHEAEREVKELRLANEILRAATAFFGELDRRCKTV